MKYKNFEELPVWNAAIEFALHTFAFTEKVDFRGLGDTRSQLERAAISISNNVAEGFERGTNAELINFLYIAKGSAGESRSILRLCERSNRFSNFKFEISNLVNEVTGISRQLNGWLTSLQGSDIKGVKFLDRKAKQRNEKNKEFEDFDRQMAEFKRNLEQQLIQRDLDAAVARQEI